MTIEISLMEVLTWLESEAGKLPPSVERRARQLFLDTLGCMVAGLAKPEPKALVAELAAMEPGQVTLPAAAGSLTIGSAAYIVGLAACWDEACEGLPRAHGRPGLHAFAAVIALGLARGHSLDDVLQALVAGFEVGGRLGEFLRIPPGMHVDGTWGTFAAATAAAQLLGLNAEQTLAALQAAACQLPWSLYQPIAQGATTRNTYVGEAARRGISHALAVSAGITTPTDAFETFDRLALGREPETKCIAPAGEWLIEQGYLKPFAAVRHVHYGAQAAIDWRRQHRDVDTSTITAIELQVYGEAITYCGNRAPTTPIQAQFSLSYGSARALIAGDLGPDAYLEESLNHPETRRLESLVQIVEEPTFSSRNIRAARLTVTTPNGAETILVDAVPGEPDLPLQSDEVEAKFLRYAGPILGSVQAEGLAARILRGEKEASLADVFAD